MRVKRFITTTVAMMIMLAVIGSGFSYWFFEQSNITNASQSATDKEVTQYVTVGTITPAANIKVTFDQTAAGRTANSGNGSGVNLGANDKTEGIKVSGTGTIATYADPNTAVDSVGFKFSVKIVVSKDLAEYFDITATSAGGWTRTDKTTNGENVEFTFEKEQDTEFDWATDIELKYNDTKEPANKSAYDTFKSIVEAGSITATYTVTVHTLSN